MNQMDIHLHHIANGAVSQAAPVMRKGKQAIGQVYQGNFHTLTSYLCYGLK